MSGLLIERLRTGYDSNRPAVWLLLALSALVLAARHLSPFLLVGRFDDQLLAPGDVLSALPIVFAAAVLLVAPRRRLLVAGALVLAWESCARSMEIPGRPSRHAAEPPTQSPDGWRIVSGAGAGR